MHTPHLTLSDRWILMMLAAGYSIKRVSLELHLGTDQVKRAVSRILEHYGARNRTEAIGTAYRRGDL